MKKPMLPAPRQLVDLLLESPGVAAAVQRLEAPVLRRLIDSVGLEDAGDIVALASTEQLAEVFDEDLWQSERAGEEETFSADRFTTWLAVMMELGAAHVASRLTAFEEEFVVMALSSLVYVFDLRRLHLRALDDDDPIDEYLDKLLESALSHEFADHLVYARDEAAWDNVLDVLLALDAEHEDFLERLMNRLIGITNEMAEESGGMYDLLTAADELHQDVAFEREQRRERKGFVAPRTAAGFLEAIGRQTPEHHRDDTAKDYVTEGYFEQLSNGADAVREHESKRGTRALETGQPAGNEIAEDSLADEHRLLGLLRDAEVLRDEQPLRLTTGANGTTAFAHVRKVLEMASDDPQSYAARAGELAYLANVLVAGCSFEGRRMRPVEAAEAALAVCNLGLEWLAERPSPESGTSTILVRPFKIGWSLLRREVHGRAGESLQAWLAHRLQGGPDRELSILSASLRKALHEGKPWRVYGRLDALGNHLPPETVVRLKGLFDECPTWRPADDSLTGREFVASLARLQDIGAFCDSLVDENA